MKSYFTPEWLSLIFGFAMLVPPVLIASFASQNTTNKDLKKVVWWAIILFYAFYFLYIYFAEKFGLFREVMLPPKILLFTTVPYAILLFGIIYQHNFTKSIFDNSQLSDLVKLHSFRLIGGVFLILAFYEALPKTFALLAGFGDVITALSCFYVAKSIDNKAANARKLTLIWNTFGLIDILTTAVLANVLTKISIDSGAMGVDTLAYFPYCLIPAFAPPTIIFLHLQIYKKIKKF